MIGKLTGVVESVDSSTALIDVDGVGFEVRMPGADLTALRTGERAAVFTSMSVAQDAVTLFGFLSRESKRVFLQLQKVSGIGPKVALSLLSTLTPEQLAQAIHEGDAAALAKAPGLGRKGAQKIILELKGSIDLATAGQSGAASAHAPQDAGMQQVLEGLISLGWSKQDAQEAIDGVMEAESVAAPLEGQDVPRVLRAALAALDRGR